ncbi:MAG: L-2-amino-thiazoline-4-carboxylic acid hydrolase [Gammaproteobacteria bacterium]
MSELSYLDRVKVQCEILLPFYRRVRAELGAEKAAAMLREAVREYGLGMGQVMASAIPGESVAQVKAMMPMFAAGNALDVEPVADTPAEFSVNVRGCRYAEYFKGLDEAEFGAMITCEADWPMMETFTSTVTMERTRTIMSGGGHCDFRWRAKS